VTRLRTTKNLRSGGLTAFVTAASIALTACAAPSTPNVASVGTTTTTAATNGGRGTTSADPLLFAGCMRSNGVPNWPDPSGNGKFLTAQQLGVSSSRLSAAEKTCVHLLPAGTNDQFPAAERPQILSSMLNFSRCMRSHGVPNWPDPTVDSEGRPYFPVSGVPGLEHDYRLPPKVMTSDGKCHHLLPEGGGMPLG
jgi:hypothetical protein